jgi:hypothetical protein
MVPNEHPDSIGKLSSRISDHIAKTYTSFFFSFIVEQIVKLINRVNTEKKPVQSKL